jgi:hypothetical protein
VADSRRRSYVSQYAGVSWLTEGGWELSEFKFPTTSKGSYTFHGHVYVYYLARSNACGVEAASGCIATRPDRYPAGNDWRNAILKLETIQLSLQTSS